MIGCCAKCRTVIVEACPTCKRTSPKNIYVERQLRLNNLQNHTAPFCIECALHLAPADFPAVMASIRESFEAAWKKINAAPEFVVRERAQWARLEIIGFAEEIRGLEHGRTPLEETVCGRCGDPLVEGVRKSLNEATGEWVDTNEVVFGCAACGVEATPETAVTRQRLLTRDEALAPQPLDAGPALAPARAPFTPKVSEPGRAS